MSNFDAVQRLTFTQNESKTRLCMWFVHVFSSASKQQKILGQMFVPFICQTVLKPLFSRLFSKPSVKSLITSLL